MAFHLCILVSAAAARKELVLTNQLAGVDTVFNPLLRHKKSLIWQSTKELFGSGDAFTDDMRCFRGIESEFSAHRSNLLLYDQDE